jgi:hypothetical protein
MPTCAVGLCDGVWGVSLGLGMPPVGPGGQTALASVSVRCGRGGAPQPVVAACQTA